MCLVQVHVTVVFNITFKSSAPIIFYTDVLDTVVQSEHGMSTSTVLTIGCRHNDERCCQATSEENCGLTQIL